MHRLKTSMPGMEAEKAAERKKAERDVREVSVTAGPASASAIDVPSARSVTDGPTAFIALMKMKVQSTPTQSTRNSTKALPLGARGRRAGRGRMRETARGRPGEREEGTAGSQARKWCWWWCRR